MTNTVIVDLHQSEPYPWGDIIFDPIGSVWTYNLDTILNSEHSGSIEGTLKIGTYTLRVTDTYGVEHTKNLEIVRVIDLPIIPKKSIKSKYDKDGNLIIRWGIPFSLYELDPILKTKVDIRLWFFDEGEKIGAYSCKLPSYMNKIFIPKDIIEELIAKGYRYKIVALVRTNDNGNRSTSGAQKLKLKKIKAK